jgi:phenylacetate-CoA ligase
VLDYRSTVADQVEVVRRERPAYLTVYPSLLLELLRHCRENGVAFEGLRGVRTVLEVLAPEVRQLCREVLGVGVTDVYSCGEAGYLAIQCPEHRAYHLQQENVLIEILDDAGAPCAPGAVGRVVVTTLHNFAMPLLRYELGDLAEVGEPCPCGRTLPVIARIVGRARDMLTLPDGAKRYPFYGHSAMMSVRAIRQHQLVQKSLTEIEIRLVVSHPLSAAEEARIREAAIAGLGHPFEITLAYTDEIKRDASGKYAEFRSEIAAANAPRPPG